MKAWIALLIFSFSFSTLSMNTENNEALSHDEILEYIFKLIKKDEIKELNKLLNLEDVSNSMMLLSKAEKINAVMLALSQKKANTALFEVLLTSKINLNQAINISIIYNFKKDSDYKKAAYKGWTSAHFAVAFKASKEILEILHKHGCDFTQEDSGGWSAIQLAFDEKNLEACRFFIGKYNLEQIKIPYGDYLKSKNILLDNLISFISENFSDKYEYDIISGFKRNKQTIITATEAPTTILTNKNDYNPPIREDLTTKAKKKERNNFRLKQELKKPKKFLHRKAKKQTSLPYKNIFIISCLIFLHSVSFY